MKKYLGFILVLALCVSLLSVGAWAADETEHTSHYSSWTELTVEELENLGYTLTSGKYYLSSTEKQADDIDYYEMTGSQTIAVTGDVTLCLNDVYYSYGGNQPAVSVSEGASLTVCCCKLDRYDNFLGTLRCNKGVLYGIENKGTLIFAGGSIITNTENGAAVYNAGTCTISGGSVSGSAVSGQVYKTAYGIYNENGAQLTITGSPRISGNEPGYWEGWTEFVSTGPQIDILTYDTINVNDLGEEFSGTCIGFYGDANTVVVSGVSGVENPSTYEEIMAATWQLFQLTYPENSEFIYTPPQGDDPGTLTYAGHTSLTYGDTNVMDNTYYNVSSDGSGLEDGTSADYDILWSEENRTLTLNNVDISTAIHEFTYADSLFSTALEDGITINLIGQNSITVYSHHHNIDRDAYAIANTEGGVIIKGADESASLTINMLPGVNYSARDIAGIKAVGAVENQSTLTISGNKGDLDAWSGSMTGIACTDFTNTGAFTANISDAYAACAVDASGEFVNAAGASFNAVLSAMRNGTGLACRTFENDGTMDIDIDGEDGAVGIASNGNAGEWTNNGTVTIDVDGDGAPAGSLVIGELSRLAGIYWNSNNAYSFTNSGTMTVTAQSSEPSTQSHENWPTWQFFDTIAVSLMPGENSTVTNTGTMTLAAHNGYTAGLYVFGEDSIEIKNSGTMDITVDTLGGDNIRAVGIYAQIPDIQDGQVHSLPFNVTRGSVEINAGAAGGASYVMDDACMAVCLVQSFNVGNVPDDTSELQQIELNDMSIGNGSAVVAGPFEVPQIGGDTTAYISYINTIGTVDANGKAAPAAGVTILPTLTGSVAIEGSAQEGSALTANVSGLPAGAAVNYQWQRADSVDGPFEDIDGATGREYVLTGDDVGKYIRVVVTPTGGEYGGELSAMTENPVQRRSVNIPDTYDIDLIVSEGGEAKTNLSNASAGTTITVTATPDEGYELAYITVDGERIDGTTFTMPAHDVTVRVYFTNGAYTLPFTDVNSGDWFYDAVSYVYANGLMDGVSATTFVPDANMTRAMLVTILWRMEGEPVVNYLMPFTDVDGGAWYAEAVRWAASEGIVTGVSDTSFAPNAEITREQLAAILHRYAGEPATAANLAGYADGASVSAYAVDAMSWCVEHDIITGTTATTLEPQGTATRAQAAAMLMRFAENLK